MTIGIEEAQLRNRMSRYCSSRGGTKEHARCTGYYVVSGTAPPRRDLDFCQCECHSTRKAPVRPLRRLKRPPRMNPGVSGEGDSS